MHINPANHFLPSTKTTPSSSLARPLLRFITKLLIFEQPTAPGTRAGRIRTMTTTTATELNLEPGTMIDWYEIERPIRQGGMAMLYLRSDANLQRATRLRQAILQKAFVGDL